MADTCIHTGLAIPNCSCRACCDNLLRRYAPHLLPAAVKEAAARQRREITQAMIGQAA